MPQATERPAISRAEYERRVSIRRKRLRRKRIQRGIIALIVLAVLIIGIVLICKSCSSGSSITGTWDYDTVTVYRFDKDGKGALELPNVPIKQMAKSSLLPSKMNQPPTALILIPSPKIR